MNYIYSELDPSAVDFSKFLCWNRVETLPTPSAAYYMTISIVNTNGTDALYICKLVNNEFAWVSFGG